MESEKTSCSHYVRRCQLVCPSCDKAYVCRLCHDASEDHELDRFSVTSVICTQCDAKQEKSLACSKCSTKFGNYSCLKCSLYDDKDKGQFHCDGCAICRVGGREKYQHCNTCGLCLPVKGFDKHNCLPDVSKRPCSVCLEELHSSRDGATILPCRHLLHGSCYKTLLEKGLYTCPVCGKSTIDMTQEWRQRDRLVAMTLMPSSYRGVCCQVLCKDCNKETIVTFNIVGLKCKMCGSYNTTRSGGSFVKKRPVNDESNMSAAVSENPERENTGGIDSLRENASDDGQTSGNSAASNESGAPSNVSGAPSNVSGAPSNVSGASSNENGASSNVSGASSNENGASSNVSGAPSNVSGASSNENSRRLASRLREVDIDDLIANGTNASAVVAPAVTAQEELHLYTAVTLEELDAPDARADVPDNISMDSESDDFNEEADYFDATDGGGVAAAIEGGVAATEGSAAAPEGAMDEGGDTVPGNPAGGSDGAAGGAVRNRSRRRRRRRRQSESIAGWNFNP